MISRNITLAASALALMLMAPMDAYSDSKGSKGSKGSKTYKVTITNISAGQPLTPPILVTHSDDADIYEVGEYASAAVQAIAENGNGAPLMEALSSSPDVHEVVAGSAPLVPANNPGGTGFMAKDMFYISTKGDANLLSFISMLICTNDGFTALDSVKLPKKSMTFYTAGYDARTEMNTEDFADMVPPCQGLIGVSSDDPGTGMSDPYLAEMGVIIPHPGIIGGNDLVEGVHGWTDPVAKIEIERVRRRD